MVRLFDTAAGELGAAQQAAQQQETYGLQGAGALCSSTQTTQTLARVAKAAVSQRTHEAVNRNLYGR